MPSFSTPALVLRRSDYSDTDRMVTLFAPEHGRIDAIARGCRRSKSPLMNCCEPFVSGEFQLHQRGERIAIEQCQISESCFELRGDYERLRHGAYWLRLLDDCVMQDVPMPELFIIALQALAHLNYSELPPELLTMAFEMHLMKQLGLAPRVDVCLNCGRPIDGDARFDASRGGCICLNCAPKSHRYVADRSAPPRSGTNWAAVETLRPPTPPTCCAPGQSYWNAPLISNGARRILLKLPRTRYDQVKLLDGYPDWPEAARLFRPYVELHIPTRKFAPPLYEPQHS